uniref:Uncharacterized protein n=1 Tax=Physcomitrium patens TaxID=3218 RepID=A0A7I4FUF6_PHYPA
MAMTAAPAFHTARPASSFTIASTSTAVSVSFPQFLSGVSVARARHLSAATRVATSSSNAGVPGFEDDVYGMFTLDEDVFEKPSPASTLSEVDPITNDDGANSLGLVPQEWRSVKEELAKTKKQKKRELLDSLERKAKEREQRERMLLRKQIAGREEYNEKFFPRTFPESVTTEVSDDEDGYLFPNSEFNEVTDAVPVKRATPKNPRLVLGNATFEDMARMLSAGKFDEREPPAEASKKSNDVENMEVSGSKLLTTEEKAMLKINEVDFTKVTSRKWDPLHTFAISGQINQLDLLLRRGSSINTQDMDGWTALHWAAICSGSRDAIFRYILKSAAHTTVTDKDGATVLHFAARNANSFAIKAMLRHDADINACDSEGWTPLHVAVQSGRTDIVNLLIARGADTTIQNRDGNTPLDLALSFGHEFRFYEVFKLLKNGTKGTAFKLSINGPVELPRLAEPSLEGISVENQEAFKLMNEEERRRFNSNILDFSVITSKKWHPLHTFAASGQINHVDLLLRRGVDVNTRDTNGFTELHWAIICGRDRIIRYLLKSGADVKAIDKDGASVLHYATRSGNIFAVKAVLRQNASINACDSVGFSTWHWTKCRVSCISSLFYLCILIGEYY